MRHLSSTTQVNGVTLGYREFGSGEPLLMIEGFGATIDDWNETFIGILATNYHVYTYDEPGDGIQQRQQRDTHHFPVTSDDAAAMMTALGYDSMNVYGASIGVLDIPAAGNRPPRTRAKTRPGFQHLQRPSSPDAEASRDH